MHPSNRVRDSHAPRTRRWIGGWSLSLAAIIASGGCDSTQMRGLGMGGGGDAAFRTFGPRRQENIFTRIDMPTPNESRLVSGKPGLGYWQQQADYIIEATLDAEAEQLKAHATITYTNNSPHDLSFLWLHLEQNLFKKGSTGDLLTPPPPARPRFGNRDAFEGGFEVSSVRVRRGPGQSPTPLTLRVYDTIGRLDLPQPVEGGGGVVIFDVEWTFNIPRYGSDRMGIDPVEQGKVFEMAQWFPAVAVYDDVYGWNTLPYLGAGEFYTDIGNFDVALSVPRTHVVAATGELQNPQEVLSPTQLARWNEAKTATDRTVMIRNWSEIGQPGDRPAAASAPAEGTDLLTWRYKADHCRTFAWASSDAFIWDGKFLRDSGPMGANGMPSGTFCQSFYPKEASPDAKRPGSDPADTQATGQWGKSTEMLAFAIDGYNRRWFRYPYPTANNINGNVGGMEYPMIIFCGDRYDEKGLYGVTTHEIGHNWFPMTVNTDERRHAWMDEGFNTFINYYSWRERFPDDEQSRRGNGRPFTSSMLLPDQQPMELPADQVTRLGIMEYEKTAVALVILRDYVLGPERFDPAFREYIQRWAFRSPRPWDFFRCMEDGTGADLSWYWRGWFLESATLDQAIESVTQTEAQEGVPTRVDITLRNRRDMVMPVVARVVYDDGTEEIKRWPVEIWFTSDRWATAWECGGKRVVSITLDPQEMLPDADLTNNVWKP